MSVITIPVFNDDERSTLPLTCVCSCRIRKRTCQSMSLRSLAYADDTMAVAFSASRAEAYVDCIARAGGDHRLCFDRRKLEPTMPILCVLNVLKRDGHPVECKSSLVYLGCLLENAADIGPELNRRLGSARADFQAPDRVSSFQPSLEACLRLFCNSSPMSAQDP